MKKQLKAGVVLSYAQIAISIVVGLVYIPIMINMLGDEEYGLYSTVTATISMLTILSLGFNSSYIRYYAKYKKSNDTESIYKLNGLFLIIFLIIGAIGFICGIFLTYNLGLVFDQGLTASQYETAKVLMLLLTINLTVSFPMSVFQSIISAHERFVFLKLFGMTKTILSPVVSIIALYMGYKSVAIVSITLAISIGTDILYFLYVVYRLKNKFIFRGFEKGIFKDLFAYTAFIAINLIVDQINWAIDKPILVRFKGPAVAGIYSIGFSLYNYYMMFSNATSGLFAPKVHRIANENKENVAEQKRMFSDLFTRVGRIQFLILSLLATGFVFFGKAFVRFWIDDGYDNGYYVAMILILSATIPLIQNVGIEIQRALNKHQFRSIVYLIMACINVVLTIFAVQKYGEIGAAASTAVSLVVANGLIMNIYYHKKCNINILCFWKNILRQSVGLIIPVAFGVVIMLFVEISSIWALILWIGAYSVVYCASMFFLGMNKYERGLILNPLRKVLGR